MRVIIQGIEIQNHFDTDIIEDSNFSEILVDYIQENYFNGADSAVIYIGYDPDNEYFEFDLMPG